ncbi:hypothetical protein AN958_11634, partial [Leucoagaricus sp. SymC.cos]
FVASQVTAQRICPGYNFSIGSIQNLGGGLKQWAVYDDNCNRVDGLITSKNPCTQKIFGCTPSPVTFNVYSSTFTGYIYDCRPDPHSGTCGNDVISACVSLLDPVFFVGR